MAKKLTVGQKIAKTNKERYGNDYYQIIGAYNKKRYTRSEHVPFAEIKKAKAKSGRKVSLRRILIPVRG